MEQSHKPPRGLVTPLHVPVRPWTDISMNGLKLTAVFMKCSTMYPNIEIDNDQMPCISRIYTIFDRHTGYKFLIPIQGNFKAEQGTRTHGVNLLHCIRYTNTIVFDRDSLFMSDHFQAWAAFNGILLQPSTA